MNLMNMTLEDILHQDPDVVLEYFQQARAVAVVEIELWNVRINRMQDEITKNQADPNLPSIQMQLDRARHHLVHSRRMVSNLDQILVQLEQTPSV